jgi:hypothetical protein
VIGAPTDLVFGPDGNLYVATIVQVQRFDGATGQFLDVFASGGTGSALFALAFGPDGNLYVSDNLGNEVAKFDGDTGARLAGFRECGSPLGLAFGPDGLLYVSCGRASIVRLDPTTGAVVDTFVAPGNGGLTVPLYMAFTPSATGVEERLAELLDSVIGVGPGTSLADKVEAAQAMYAQGDEAGTCEILGALIKQVEAQSGQQIPATKANALITDATAIREEIGC